MRAAGAAETLQPQRVVARQPRDYRFDIESKIASRLAGWRCRLKPGHSSVCDEAGACIERHGDCNGFYIRQVSRYVSAEEANAISGEPFRVGYRSECKIKLEIRQDTSSLTQPRHDLYRTSRSALQSTTLSCSQVRSARGGARLPIHDPLCVPAGVSIAPPPHFIAAVCELRVAVARLEMLGLAQTTAGSPGLSQTARYSIELCDGARYQHRSTSPEDCRTTKALATACLFIHRGFQ